MEIPLDYDESIAGLLIDLENASKTPVKQRAIKISNLVEELCSAAYENGLSNASLSKLVDIITLPNELDQASLGSLIRYLYPGGKVSDSVVIRVVGSLGHGRAKPSYAAQAALLKWLVLVYDVLENQRVMSQLYAILFNLLDTIAIRQPLCHVLSLVTRRKHVRPFRIQALMELTRQAGNEPPLVGLMKVYKDYYPDVIIGDVVSGRASVFVHPNHEWRQRLGEIREIHFQKSRDDRAPEQRTCRVTQRGASRKLGARSSIIPNVHTSHVLESSVTLEEIEDVIDFVRKLEKIEPPNQLVAVLGDPLLQKFLQLRSSEIYSKRVDSWLMAFFEDQLQNPEQSKNDIMEILEAVHGYTCYTKELPTACLTYLKSMIYTWNGIEGREVILNLLSYVPMALFEDLYEPIFQPLEDAVLDDEAIKSRLDLLTFYKNLIDRWMVTFMSHPYPLLNAGPAINSLIIHASRLAVTIIQMSQSVSTLSTVLNFYESTASAISHPTLKSSVRITIPPAELIYTLNFTSSLCTLSRLCAILAVYKRAFEIAMAPKTASTFAMDQQPYPKEYVNHFNGFLMDICNCLWRSRALNTSEPNALGCLIPAPITAVLTKYVTTLDKSLSLQNLFSFSLSPVFCLVAISYVRELEDTIEDDIERRHAGPVTQNSLMQLEKYGGLKLSWPDYKLGVLQYMENKGAAGVGQLMYNTMKHLITARENRA